MVEAVTAMGLALGVDVTVVSSRAELRHQWPHARLRLVGTDVACRNGIFEAWPETWVVGRCADELVGASSQLDAPALLVPDLTGRLARMMTAAMSPTGAGRVIAVSGASGGVGTSSLCVGLAMHAATRERVALVELARSGGGIDLLLGAETQEGLRWDALAQARGELGQLDSLVRADGISLVALDRDQPVTPHADAVHAVVTSLARSHSHVVVDAGCGLTADVPASASELMVVAADVRGVAAARMVLDQRASAPDFLVVRRSPWRQLPPDAIAKALGLPLAGVARHDPRVPRLAGDGANVAAPVARRFRRDICRIWEGISA